MLPPNMAYQVVDKDIYF